MVDDDDLERVIADLIERKNAAAKGSAAQGMAVRELDGLRYNGDQQALPHRSHGLIFFCGDNLV
jgi:hypothetical protein